MIATTTACAECEDERLPPTLLRRRERYVGELVAQRATSFEAHEPDPTPIGDPDDDDWEDGEEDDDEDDEDEDDEPMRLHGADQRLARSFSRNAGTGWA